MTQYSINPADANFQGWVDDHHRRRNEYWQKLQMARADWFNNTVETEHPSTDAFYYFMQHKWGIKMNLDSSKNITASYQIIDESKYLMFLMKYGH